MQEELFGRVAPSETLKEEQGKVAKALVAGWVEMQKVRPDDRDIAKQAVAARRIAKRDYQNVATAVIGIQKLFPYSKGEPWDLFDLERKFSKCVAAGRTALEEKSKPTGIAAIMEARS
jgi:hypothetical protein